MSKLNSPDNIELPKRKWSHTAQSIEESTRRRGGNDEDIAKTAKMVAYAEWDEDLDWIESERQRLGLPEGCCIALKEAARERNRQVWGIHSWTPD
jgi:hypothetical protein